MKFYSFKSHYVADMVISKIKPKWSLLIIYAVVENQIREIHKLK